MAAAAKAAGIPVLYYISPKVWAWKPSRLEKIKKYVDHAALIFPFEVPLYRKWKIPHTFVGNPLLDCRDYSSFHVFQPEKPVIGLLPGSRNSEIDKLLDPLLQAALKIARQRPGSRFLLSRAGAVNGVRFDQISDRHRRQMNFQVIHGDVAQILSTADLVIAASGTVSLEAALFRVPTIIVYKMSRVTYSLARLFVRLNHVGLANIIAGEEVMPELLQGDATPEKISETALCLLDHHRLPFIQTRLERVSALLGGKGASQRVAALALAMATFPTGS